MRASSDPEVAVAGDVPPVEGGVAGRVGVLEPAGDDLLAAAPDLPGLDPVDAVDREERGDRLRVVRLPGLAVGVDPAPERRRGEGLLGRARRRACGRSAPRGSGRRRRLRPPAGCRRGGCRGGGGRRRSPARPGSRSAPRSGASSPPARPRGTRRPPPGRPVGRRLGKSIGSIHSTSGSMSRDRRRDVAAGEGLVGGEDDLDLGIVDGPAVGHRPSYPPAAPELRGSAASFSQLTARVVAAAADAVVEAAFAVELVVAAAAEQRVRAVVAGEDVVAGRALDLLGARSRCGRRCSCRRRGR